MGIMSGRLATVGRATVRDVSLVNTKRAVTFNLGRLEALVRARALKIL
jgi:hypothetical protein